MSHVFSPGEGVRARIDAYLARSPWSGRARAVTVLAGDASDRCYARVTLAGGESIVLALYSGPVDANALPFVLVADLFRQMPVRVPALFDHSGHAGILALEDLGDVTLQRYLACANRVERLAAYRQAVDIIRVIQDRGAALASERYPPFALAFDEAKLTAELDFFTTHFLEAHRGIALSPAERDALGEEWRRIATELAAEPRVLCHRDFHSRNLMMHRGQLVVIDFQDARMGPDTYDLVSLLRDCYVDLEAGERDILIDAFLGPAGRAGAGSFRTRFDVMSLQRHLKALGTFGYQATAKRRTEYLADVPRTLGYLRQTLHRHERFARLLAILAGHVGEIR